MLQAIGSVGALIGAPLSGLLADHSGRQLTIVLCNVPLTIGWMLILVSNIVTGHLFRPLLFTGRFIVGVGAGATIMSTPVSTSTQILLHACMHAPHVRNHLITQHFTNKPYDSVANFCYIYFSL